LRAFECPCRCESCGYCCIMEEMEEMEETLYQKVAVGMEKRM